MKLSERERQIIEILKKEKYASVEHLAKMTYISASSVRRDLARLEQMGFVERSYGGASIAGSGTDTPHLVARMAKNARAKRKIAQKASRLLKDGMTVILDSSTTAYYMVDLIAEKKNITLITNGIYTAQRAIGKGITVYLTGGRSEGGRPVLTGSYAEEALEKMNADIVFFSSMAMTDSGVICDCTESENKIRKIMLKRASVKVLLIDKSKLGKNAQHVLCSKDDVDHIITEE
ncbi:MAG: DeoR/GlpR transcriptional regulator [Ruminococcaceae bacterium]|nr:DeoR/GlpR transcriptional regulator [Oscillospiraceae bacterium]